MVIKGQQSRTEKFIWSFDRQQFAFEGAQSTFEQDTIQFICPQKWF
jgi:hypothetical protein